MSRPPNERGLDAALAAAVSALESATVALKAATAQADPVNLPEDMPVEEVEEARIVPPGTVVY